MNEPAKYFATLRPVSKEGTRKAFDRGHVFLVLIELQANQVVVWTYLRRGNSLMERSTPPSGIFANSKPALQPTILKFLPTRQTPIF